MPAAVTIVLFDPWNAMLDVVVLRPKTIPPVPLPEVRLKNFAFDPVDVGFAQILTVTPLARFTKPLPRLRYADVPLNRYARLATPSLSVVAVALTTVALLDPITSFPFPFIGYHDISPLVIVEYAVTVDDHPLVPAEFVDCTRK